MKVLNTFEKIPIWVLVTQICATLWAFTLPSIKTSLYFHRQNDLQHSITEKTTYSDQKINDSSIKILYRNKNLGAFQLLWSHFKNAYTNIKVIQWSIWYSVALCGYLQVASYIQVLWKDIEPNPPVAWNGAVDAILTAVGAAFAILAGYLHTYKLTPRKSLLLLALLSIFEGCAILLATWTKNLYVSYSGFIIFGALYAFTITVASAEVARYLEEESFGLVFGINTFIALVLQTILTLIVVSESGLTLNVADQYAVYSFYFITIGIIYTISVICDYLLWKLSVQNSSL